MVVLCCGGALAAEAARLTCGMGNDQLFSFSLRAMALPGSMPIRIGGVRRSHTAQLNGRFREN
jgi:hypothetical protein